ncbi:MAG: thioredoxin [Phycisphaerae bacterium SM23_30]|nr:MAG: thioredoxin [Phycisphaerae bacterium SM23_30]
MADSVVELTDDNFETEVTQSSQPVLVDFWAEWCGPCRMMAPIIEELAEEYVGKAKIGNVDTDKNRDTAVKFGISAIPTTILFHNGEATKKFVGLTSKRDLKAALDEIT